MSAVPLDDVKKFLNITTSGDDTELQAMVDRAESVLAARVGPLSATTVAEERHTGPGPLVLRRYPVVSITSVTDNDRVIALADLDLDTDSGRLYGYFSSIHRGIKVTYTAGRSTLPADLEAAVLELTGHLWESQRRPMHGRPGFSDSEVNPEVGVGSKYLLPYRVQTLIDPHLLRNLP